MRECCTLVGHYGPFRASYESFRQNGPWIESSTGFKVRSRGRAGMEYVRGQLRLGLDAEALASPAPYAIAV